MVESDPPGGIVRHDTEQGRSMPEDSTAMPVWVAIESGPESTGILGVYRSADAAAAAIEAIGTDVGWMRDIGGVADAIGPVWGDDDTAAWVERAVVQ